MFVVSLTYLCGLEKIEKHLPAHLAYLQRHYATGTFLASGRKNPRSGGVILAMAENQSELQCILAEDPFKIHHLADYEVTEFIPSRTAPELAFLLE
jgi:uncharacterized protein YciI